MTAYGRSLVQALGHTTTRQHVITKEGAVLDPNRVTVWTIPVQTITKSGNDHYRRSLTLEVRANAGLHWSDGQGNVQWLQVEEHDLYGIKRLRYALVRMSLHVPKRLAPVFAIPVVGWVFFGIMLYMSAEIPQRT
jgi:hypothetical protein